MTIAKQKSLVIPGRFLHFSSKGTYILRTLNHRAKPLKLNTDNNSTDVYWENLALKSRVHGAAMLALILGFENQE
jgi:hypothetical protein